MEDRQLGKGPEYYTKMMHDIVFKETSIPKGVVEQDYTSNSKWNVNHEIKEYKSLRLWSIFNSSGVNVADYEVKGREAYHLGKLIGYIDIKIVVDDKRIREDIEYFPIQPARRIESTTFEFTFGGDKPKWWEFGKWIKKLINRLYPWKKS